MNRTFIAHSPLGEQLEFRSLEGSEQISRLFEYRVRLISQSASISAKSLLGKDMSVEVDLTTKLGGGGKRFLSGQVTQFTYIGRDGDFYSYEAVLRPWLWHATRRSDFKIFQFKKVPDIIKEVLGPYGFTIEDKLTGSYRTWDYMVQYGETDFNFVARLLEIEGGYFYFEHSQGSHKLVLADDIGSHSPLPSGPSTITYYSGDRAAHVHDEDFIDGWSFAEDIASGHFAADDYDFEKPKAILDTKQQQPAGHTEDSRELYDWPGGYTETGDGENYARVRIEQQKAQREVAQGEGNARNIAPGYLFTLTRYPREDQNKEYLIESAYYRFEENVRRSDGAGGSGAGKRAGIDSPTSYRISFNVVPKSVPYRSQRVTPKPHTTGPQTAVITGPAGEEIYTDKYGRVKVQFHWDRYGKMDENSSCWIRVSQTWAGSNYGGMHIPRIGQEVIVDFLNGDPDYPIITGRVYNALQMPPWELPKHKTQSGTQTNWSKGGGGKNMLRFEDQKGIEHLELSSDHGNTHLHMGYLLNQGSEAKRSYGFELRTNEWGAIRADKGLLITTYTSDFKQKISHDSPDGHEFMGETLAQSRSLIQETEQAINATKGILASTIKSKSGDFSGLMQGLPGIASMVGGMSGGAGGMGGLGGVAGIAGMVNTAASALGGGDEGGGESSVSSDMDPALADAQNMLDLSKKIDKPIVSIVSPEGQTMISPKPVVVSSGQSVSMRSQGPMTVTTGAQYTQLVKNGIVTQVSSGGQITTVSAGDIISHSLTGATNILAKADASMTSTAANANLVGEKSVLVHGKTEDVFIKASQRIALVCGESAIVLLADGTIVLQGKKGLLSFTEELDERGGKILLNCAAPVGSEAPPVDPVAQLTMQMQQLADAKKQLAQMPPGPERDKMAADIAKAENDAHALQMAKLSQNTYAPEKGAPPGWGNISGDDAALEKYGLKKEDLKYGTQVYEPDPAVFGPDAKPVVAFRGTRMSEMEDWKNNLQQGVGLHSDYFESAVGVGTKVGDSGAAVDFTGHSLGGGMASAASRASGQPATTFNSSGLNSGTVEKYGGTMHVPATENIQAYRIDGDVLTGAQEQNVGGTLGAMAGGGVVAGPVGAVVGGLGKVGLAAGMPDAVGVPQTLPGTGSPVSRHGIDQSVRALESSSANSMNQLNSAGPKN
ncbi:type VI secretion system tip protein TssI/VgrG [Diaphorobacter sp. HDW4A]|uniref:type VI secretion system tip protein TssI/VgrG n=1 Tax=Diaphorobacter sp. HDW4A TaxID=2714924 RepID=UPI00197FC15E|nr:type VI secretion system tip protein TssI/VgrG [Diaphorobacter sp. HDW4A]